MYIFLVVFDNAASACALHSRPGKCWNEAVYIFLVEFDNAAGACTLHSRPGSCWNEAVYVFLVEFDNTAELLELGGVCVPRGV